ncbi:MAG: hypothetical protein JO227_24600 [Acetobacteraceae bacterium]|nr:hypothetical protein [Acetobacteraceae bacterium]
MGGIRLRNIDLLVREQFRALRSVSRMIGLNDDRQRRVLLMPEPVWAQWQAFVHDGPLPAEPALPTVLRRLGAATYRLAILADRQSEAQANPLAAG